MAMRVGKRLVDHVLRTLRGQRRVPERMQDLAFYVRREIGVTISPALGAKVLAMIEEEAGKKVSANPPRRPSGRITRWAKNAEVR